MKILIATVLAVLVADVAIAKDVSLSACTADHVKETVSVSLKDDASPATQKAIETAYRLTAAELDSETFESYDGYLAFAKRLTDEELAAINQFNDHPHPTGNCAQVN